MYDTGDAGPGDRYDQRRQRAALLGPLAFPGAVAVGVSALILHGVAGAPTEAPPEVTLPDGSSRIGGGPVLVRRLPLRRWNIIDGIPVATVEDALAQAVPRLGQRHALALLDSALHQGLITQDGVARAHAAAAGRRGVARTHAWWGWADARAESPAESWARAGCLRLGIAPDVLQLPVVGSGGRVVARVDLAWLLSDGGWLLVEVDGRDVHSTPEAQFRDRRRQNLLDTRRTVLRRFTGREAWNGELAAAVARDLRAASWRPRPQTRPLALHLDG
ncbi:hypothetical protein EV386_2620 [Xylanimonas ulmi]|uniref:DUF559 domain-containing protein n=1 Tax=Xylanimonas ulmi TaxID=228973 RepID=A0A4Q7M6M8_9MICO|nr:hypothetical protein EV386_2620 [Xylanibacterium ulmi]